MVASFFASQQPGYGFSSPSSLFAAGEEGVWYDPSDLSTMFQDTAGTIPVTDLGQTVALILDKSGRGNHATQAAAASRPVYQIDGDGRAYLGFDGIDDFLVTGNIDPSGATSAQIFARVRKLSDVAAGIVAETGVNAATQNGSVALLAPHNPVTSFGFRTRGTAGFVVAFLNASVEAPVTSFLAGLSSISAPFARLRVQGVDAAESTASQGAGAYLSRPLYIGRRGGSSFPFNGRIYRLILRFGPNLNPYQIRAAENYLNQKTGAW